MRFHNTSFKLNRAVDGPLASNEKLFFLHLYKTGGTSVHDAISPNFLNEEICPERLNQFSFWPPEALRQYRFFSAHAYLSQISYLPNDLRIVTVLREPIARLSSQFSYLRSVSVDEEIQGIVLPALYPKMSTLQQWLSCDRHEIYSTFWNVQTVCLAGHPLYSPNGTAWRSDDELLDAAIDHLDKLSIFGITEYMDETIELFCRTLDIGNFLDATPKNVTPRLASEPDGDELADAAELIHDATRLDSIVYNYAREKFLSKIPSRRRRLRGMCSNKIESRNSFDGLYYLSDAPGLVMYGPYLRLSAGRYVAAFSITLEPGQGEIGDQPLLRIEACSNKKTHIVFAERTVTGSELELGMKTEIKLYFCLDNLFSGVEFRAFSVGEFAMRIDAAVYIDESGPDVVGT